MQTYSKLMVFKRAFLYLTLLTWFTPTFAVANTDVFRTSAPANSIYYIDGPLAQLYDLLQQDIHTNTAVVSSWLQANQGQSTRPNTKLTKFIETLSTSLAHQLMQRSYGGASMLGEQGSFAFYFNHLLPVLKLTLDHPDTMLDAVHEAAKVADLPYSERMIGHTTVHLWHLYQPSQQQLDGILLAAVKHKNTVTIAMVTDTMANPKMAELLGLKASLIGPPLSVKFDALEEKFSLKNHPKQGLFGRLDIVELVRALLNNTNDKSPSALNRRRQMHSLGLRLNEEISPVCESEILQLMSKTPHAIVSINTKDNVITSQLTLDIADPDLAQQLMNINGVLQTMSSSSPQPLVNLSIGLNVSEIPALMATLGTYLDNVNFNCPKLEKGRVQLVQQLDVKSWIFYALLAQGVQGGSTGLFDFSLRDGRWIPDYFDAYVSVYLDDFDLITNIWDLLPILDQQVLPDEGQVIAITHDDIPDDIKLLMTRNQHELRIFSGPKATQWALAPHATSHHTAGVFGFDLNLSQVAKKWHDKLMYDDDKNLQWPCYLAKPLSLVGTSPTFNMSNTTKFTNEGLVFTHHAEGAASFSKALTPFQVGAYDVAKLDSNCRWKTLATLNFRTNSQGAIHTWPDASGCITYDGSFRITPKGNELTMMNYYTLNNSCTGQTKEQLDEWQCWLILQHNNTYICAENNRDEMNLYRFKPPAD